MIGGEAIDLGAPPTPSGEARPPFWKPRVTMKTWSRESTHVPPISPVTQPFGRLGPERIGHEPGGVETGAVGGGLDRVRHDPRSHQGNQDGAYIDVASAFHDALLLHPPVASRTATTVRSEESAIGVKGGPRHSG